MSNGSIIKKVLLINPPAVVKPSRLEDLGAFPLGLAYIAATLEAGGLEVEILDCFIEGFDERRAIENGLIRIGISDEAILAAVARSAPELIGVSIPFSCLLASALHVNTLIKKTNPEIITAAGGAHVSAAPESLEGCGFDHIIAGEGEYRLLNLIKAINSAKTIADNVPVHPHDFIEDLDSLPFPTYRLLPLEKYWRARGNRRWVNMIATRGCPHNCVFCSIHNVMGKKVRYRSVENVLQEVLLLRRQFGVNEIFFEDDNLTLNMQWAKELFVRIIQENLGLKIFFRNGIRADRVDMELLGLMKKAGVRQVWFAPESGSQETLDRIIKKRMKLEDCEDAIRMAKSAGLEVACFLVIGFPEETVEDVRKTITYGRRLKQLGCDYIWVSCAMPYPGTELFAQCLKKGIIREDQIDYQSMATTDAIIGNEWFSVEEIKRIRDQAMRDLNRPGLKEILKAVRRAAVLLATDPLFLMKKIRAAW
ncbi:MAG: radical SAM protein [Candidatus Sumerlaeota bacterium]|nr:radical SAM protein [Candidatus Sumerlaeota bacterium]